MSPHLALRQALAVLGVTGSLVPGVTGPGAPIDRSAPATSAFAQAGEDARRTTVPTTVPSLGLLRRTWDWPLQPRPVVTARFVPPRSAYGAGHRGLDLAAGPGQSVLAVDEGVVTHVGVVAGRGTVSVTHATGLRSTYEPVHGAVTIGTVVEQGQVVGTVEGRTHCGGGCLHLGAVRTDRYVDPRPLLGGRVILLPLAAAR